MRNTLVYCSIKIRVSGLDELLEIIFFLLLVVETFSLHKVVQDAWRSDSQLARGHVAQLVKNRPAVQTWVWSWVGKIPWRRLPLPVFWPGEFHGLYSPWSCKELNTTEWLSLTHSLRWIWWMKQNFVSQFVQLLKCCCVTCVLVLSWRRIEPFLLTNASYWRLQFLVPVTELVISGCCIKSTFHHILWTNQEMVHCCWVE